MENFCRRNANQKPNNNSPSNIMWSLVFKYMHMCVCGGGGEGGGGGGGGLVWMRFI